MKPLYTFLLLQSNKSLWYKLQELLTSEIFLPQNMSQSAFRGFPNDKDNFEIIKNLHLIFNYYLFRVRVTRKISLEGLKKIVIEIQH